MCGGGKGNQTSEGETTNDNHFHRKLLQRKQRRSLRVSFLHLYAVLFSWYY
jgi:hypothetical protein